MRECRSRGDVLTIATDRQIDKVSIFSRLSHRAFGYHQHVTTKCDTVLHVVLSTASLLALQWTDQQVARS